VSDARKVGSVLVIGGGIGGMQAALDLAESSFKVYLLEHGPSIGGVMAMLDKTFPTNDCAMCTLAPRLVEVARHHNIELFTNTEIEETSGEAGSFRVTLRRRTRYVDEEKCTGCGICMEHCPVETRDVFNQGLSSRPAAYLLFPQAIPRIFTIDRELCLGCGLCKNLCGPGAVDYRLGDEVRELEVGAIVAAPGFEIFDPSLNGDLGYGKFPNVITSLEFERILSASGPFRGTVLRPSDGKSPRRIAFIQCVGSRDCERDYCSSVCCMYATKEALIAREHIGEHLDCDIFFMDMRSFSKGFEEYYERAKDAGVRYIRCRPPAIEEIPETEDLIITYLTEDDRKSSGQYDLVVLSAGILPPKSAQELADRYGLSLDKNGFCRTTSFDPVSSSREGIYVAGPFTEPKDIPETVVQASAAASKAMSFLADERGQLITHKEYPPEKDVTGEEPRIGVFVCHCGKNIGGVADVPEVVEYAKTLPNVVHAEDNLYTCSVDSQIQIKKIIEEEDLNRVVVASCSPRTHEPLFRNTCREACLNEYLFEMANIRDQNTWVHMSQPDEATRKAKDLVRMAVAKARLLEPLRKRTVSVNHDALVIGGGISGMTAALNLADQDFTVHLVEGEKELGGQLRHIHYLLGDEEPQRQLAQTIDRVESHVKINVYTEAKITDFEGFFGNFKTRISSNHTEKEIEHGAVIVATGAEEYKPTEYLYGENNHVMTQRELEEKLTNNDFSAGMVLMIQCVGSREEDRPYCSRVCCSQAVKNALKIKETHPETDVFILYRDIRTYGFREEYYTKARQRGVRFIRYDDENKPDVSADNGKLQVSVLDATLNLPLRLEPDLVVLSPAIVPREGAEELAKLLKVPLTQDKFFLEAHMKLRPIDFATDGIFLCGLAHFPKSVDESISHASATASRAATILAKDELELEATISEVVDENCDGCAYCIDPCPYSALTLIEYMRDGAIGKTVEADESKCKGCGVCQATCPKLGIFIRGFKIEQIGAMVDAALEV